MAIIKLVLLLGVAVVGVLAFRGGQSAGHRAFWRLAAIAVVLCAAFSIAFPDALTQVAQVFGVRRGADLLLYLLVVTFMVVALTLHRKISELEQRYIRLVRSIAVDTAVRDQAAVDATWTEEPEADA